MRIVFKPKTKLEKFGNKVLNLLVDNFPQSFFVGGTVRDLILEKKITDIDIATSAKPKQVMEILEASGIKYSFEHQNFGVVAAKQGSLNIEITTFRIENYKHNRYPKIKFTNSVLKDSQRRDFTINSLYFKPNFNIIDYHRGIRDIDNKTIRFIGIPSVRIKQDSLRIIRALRFSAGLNFQIETKSLNAIKQNFNLIDKLTQSKLKFELAKIKNKLVYKKILKILNNKNLLDKYF